MFQGDFQVKGSDQLRTGPSCSRSSITSGSLWVSGGSTGPRLVACLEPERTGGLKQERQLPTAHGACVRAHLHSRVTCAFSCMCVHCAWCVTCVCVYVVCTDAAFICTVCVHVCACVVRAQECAFVHMHTFVCGVCIAHV